MVFGNFFLKSSTNKERIKETRSIVAQEKPPSLKQIDNEAKELQRSPKNTSASAMWY